MGQESGFGKEDSDIIASSSGDSTRAFNPSITIAPTDTGFYNDKLRYLDQGRLSRVYRLLQPGRGG